jgi:O-antigen/teichoic acid export membrane protein
LLAVLAVAGQAIAYVLSVVLARRLGVAEFEAYAVAASAFILMANVAPQGLEKYGLRLLPVLIEREDWPRARGFVRFGFRRTLWGALLAGVIVAALAGRLPSIPPGVRLAVLASCLVTPIGALVHFAFETLSAAGREIRAAVAFRAAAPAVTLAAFGLASAITLPLTGAVAAACWGVGWVSALALLAAELRRALPAQVWSAPPLAEGARWAAEARPFWVYRIALGLMAQAGVISLDRLQPSSAAVGAYAAAMATASLALVLVTATNRAYARRLSILLERREFDAVITLRRQRLWWLAPVIAVFILAAFIWTRPLLALFRPEFVADGTAPLRILAVATAVSMLFALSPTYLKFSRRNRATFVTVACGAAAQVLLLLLLVPRFGATGAAIAYAVSTIGMYGAFALMAHQAIEGQGAHVNSAAPRPDCQQRGSKCGDEL